MSSLSRPVSADAVWFRFSWSKRWWPWCGFALWLLLAAFWIWIDWMDHLWNWRGGLVLPFIWLINSFQAIKPVLLGQTLDYSIAVNGEGIWHLPRKGEPAYMGWGDLVKLRDDDVQSQLVLTGTPEQKNISLNYGLNDFAKLYAFILGHTSPAAFLHVPADGIFYGRHSIKRMLFGIAVGFLTAVFLALTGGSLNWWIYAGVLVAVLATVFLAVLLFNPLSLQITRDTIVIRYPLWRRKIAFNAIRSIGRKIYSSPGTVSMPLVIELKNYKTITLRNFRDGALALNAALQAAWGQAGGVAGQPV